VLIDPNPEKVEGEMMDLVQGLPFVEPVMVRVGTLADCAGADIVIITAGSKRYPGERPGLSRAQLQDLSRPYS